MHASAESAHSQTSALSAKVRSSIVVEWRLRETLQSRAAVSLVDSLSHGAWASEAMMWKAGVGDASAWLGSWLLHCRRCVLADGFDRVEQLFFVSLAPCYILVRCSLGESDKPRH